MTSKEWRDKEALLAAMERCDCPGLSLAFLKGFEIEWQAQLGWGDAGRTRPCGPATTYQAASVSKAIFATLVMGLVDSGLLDLDRSVGGYLRDWGLSTELRAVTLRDLLGHTASTTVHGFPGYPPGKPLPGLREIVEGTGPANTAPVRAVGPAGRRFAYSGGGFMAAQAAVEAATGRSLSELVHERILGPLNMNSSHFEQPPGPARSKDAAVGHENGLPLAGGWNAYPELAAAGLWTSSADLAAFGVAVLRCHQGLPSHLALSQSAARSMAEPRFRDQGPDHLSPGMGWFCHGEGEDRTFGHRGSNEGFLAQLCLRPRDGSGLVFLANSSDAIPLLAELLEAHGFSQSL
jgi:CubicO group peptidase (beta-lactamase class C family)